MFTAELRAEAKVVQDFASSAVCKEDAHLQQVLVPWQQSVQQLEQLVIELVC